MGKKIQFRRGTKANLPSLDDGEPGWVSDEKSLYIGQSGDSILVGGRTGGIDALDYSTLALADAAAAAAGKQLIISSNWTLTGANTLTSKVKVIPGGSFTHSVGSTLTFSSSFENPSNSQCFIDFSVGDVIFGAGAVKEVCPEWWATNTTPGTTDMINALNAASQCLNDSGGGTFRAGSLEYGISDTFTAYPNIRYRGIGGGGMFGTVTPAENRGTTFVWLGGNTGTMVLMSNTWFTDWKGIGLEGTYTEGGPSTLIGVDIETNTPLVVGAKNSQRNFLRSFSIRNCETAIAFDRNFEDAGNTDGWVIEEFYFDFCNKGITSNSTNIAYATVRNGSMQVYTTGIDLERCGWIKLESIAFAGRADNSGAALHITDHSGTVIVEGCQSEGGAGRHFCIMDGGATKVTPTTFIGNYLTQPIDVDNSQDNLTFIGNYISTTVNLNGDIINCVDINNEEVAGGGFVENGTYIYMTRLKWDKQGTWTPRLFQGATEITSPTSAVGTYVKKGRLVFIKMSFNKADGAPSAAGQWGLLGLPFTSADDGVGAIITAGTVNFNGTIYSDTNPHYWRFPANSETPVLEGANSATSWTSGAIVMTLSGFYETDN